MTDQTIIPRDKTVSGEIVAENVSAEAYMEHYAEHGYEWIRGVVIKMSPISEQHEEQFDYAKQLLEAYFSLNPIGLVRGDRFVQDIASVGSKREPDLMIVLKSNPGKLTETAMLGPADICIEIVSPGSVNTDYVDKLEEYEQGGVQEYWIIDPQRQKCRFNRLQPSGLYASISPDAVGNYTTPLLPGFKLHVPTLWQAQLPNIIQVVESVQAMLKEQSQSNDTD